MDRKKKKKIDSLCCVSVFKSQENKFKMFQKNFLEIKIILKKDYRKCH